MAEHIQAEDKKKQAEYDAFVEEGKAKYANSSYKDKFDMLVNRSNLQTDVKNQKDLNTLQDTLKNNKDYCVLQIATTGFKPSEADIIFTCIYIKIMMANTDRLISLNLTLRHLHRILLKQKITRAMIILVKQVLIYRHIKW